MIDVKAGMIFAEIYNVDITHDNDAIGIFRIHSGEKNNREFIDV